MAQQIFTQRPKNAQEFLKQLEEIAKLNRQSQLKSGYDTSSNVPYIIPGSQRVGTALEGTRDARLEIPKVAGYAPEEPIVLDQPLGIEEFLTQLEQLPQPTAQPIASLPDGGTLYDNNVIYYPDGTIRDYTAQYDPNAQPVATSQDGGVIYPDGSTRRQITQTESQNLGIAVPVATLDGNRQKYSDGTIRDMNGTIITTGSDIQGGTQGLSQLAFGQQQAVTQPYGNINPMEPTPGNVNLGTDFRTRNLKSKDIRLPVNVKVVQILQDDGTRFGDITGHKGYGNSVLVELPTGERLRFSHLSTLGNVQVGQDIKPGELLGVTGQTGNTAGEHLDLEYYNKEGRIDNPANFSGLSGNVKATDNNQLQFTSAAPEKKTVGQVLGASTAQPTTPAQEISQIPSIQEKPFTNIDKPVLSSQNQSALERLATSVNAPELGVSERAQANQVPFIAQAIGDAVDTGARALGVKTDFGISELFTGGKPTVNTDQSLIGDVYAGDGELPEYKQAQSFVDVLKNIGDRLMGVDTKLSTSELPQAGEGISQLQAQSPEGFSGGNIYNKPAVSSIALGNRVGEASSPAGVDLNPSQVSGQSAQVNQAVKSPAIPAQTPSPQSSSIARPSQQTTNYGSSSSSQSVSRPSTQSSQPSSSPQRQASSAINYTPARSSLVKPTVAPKVSTPAAKTINYTPANYTPASQPTQPASQPKPQSAPSSNIFSRVVSAIKTIFKR